ncbi:MAG TPA: cbb3-type cytochrome oxidase assembly protein CcoS [Desulfuromonadaceae bacterium]|jgi:cbb3-type cytochrome oxidase maturation protein
MNNPMDDGAFLFMWIGFLLLMIVCIVAIFIWAIRTRQFSDQERARYLALHSKITDEHEPNHHDQAGRSKQ